MNKQSTEDPEANDQIVKQMLDALATGQAASIHTMVEIHKHLEGNSTDQDEIK